MILVPIAGEVATGELLAAADCVLRNVPLGCIAERLSLEYVSNAIAYGHIVGWRYFYLLQGLQGEPSDVCTEITAKFASRVTRFYDFRELEIASGLGGAFDFTVSCVSISDHSEGETQLRVHVTNKGVATFAALP